jgi:hypothetical protein
MFYNPVEFLTNANIYESRHVALNNIYAGAQNIPDNKSVFKIIGGKGIFLKITSQYSTIPYKFNQKKIKPIFYNIYDLRDYLQDSKPYTIKDFRDNLLNSQHRIMLLSGDTIFKIRNPNRLIFTEMSYPIALTFSLKDDAKIVIEDPSTKVEKYEIGDNLCYAYKQNNTYVSSVNTKYIDIIDYYNLDYDENNNNNIVTFNKITDIDTLIEKNKPFQKILVTRLQEAIFNIIKPTNLDFSKYYNDYMTKQNTAKNSK